MKNFMVLGGEKTKPIQSQSFDFAQDRFISVQCSAFSGLRQDEERALEKTKPIQSQKPAFGRKS